MKMVEIKHYNKKEQSTTTLRVEQLAPNQFRMVDNDIWDCRLTLGTEFETRLNPDGEHELIKITKLSNFLTRRFFLPLDIPSADLQELGALLEQSGGFWQIDFGGLLTLNLPKDFKQDIDQVVQDLDLRLIKII